MCVTNLKEEDVRGLPSINDSDKPITVFPNLNAVCVTIKGKHYKYAYSMVKWVE